MSLRTVGVGHGIADDHPEVDGSLAAEPGDGPRFGRGADGPRRAQVAQLLHDPHAIRRVMVAGDANPKRCERADDFVDAAQLDPIYFDTSHYVAPDGPVAEEAFRIFREALKKLNKIAIGRVVMHGKENIVALRPKDKGFLLTMMHYASEIRGAEPYFAEIKDAPVSKEQLALALQLIESTSADFDPAQFTDRYQSSLMDVIKAKIQGAAPVVVQQQQVGKVINLMDALQASIAQVKSQKATKKPAAGSIKAPAQKKAKAG